MMSSGLAELTLPTSGVGLIDDLTYSYASNGRLTGTTDATSVDIGHISGAKAYTYDNNGNTLNSGTHFLQYNLLNLPKSITTAEGVMSIEYAANGQKIRLNSSEELRYYSSGAEYKNGKIDAVHLSEGRLSYTDGTARLEYVIRDHLGNTRITFTDLNGDGVIDAKASGGELLQENHYYPFGLNVNNPEYASTADPENRYQYNGKENVSELGIEMLDYGFRWYDPAIARFTTTDPLAEDYSFQSPYAYAANNPIKFIDFMGLGPDDFIVRGTSEQKSALSDIINDHLGGAATFSIGEGGKAN